MVRKKTHILRVFDSANLIFDAVDILMDDYKSDIKSFAYLQIHVNTDVNLSPDKISLKDMSRMMQDLRPNRASKRQRDAINVSLDYDDRVSVLHALDLRVKDQSFDQIDDLLWSAGGFQSHKPGSWFRRRAKKNIQFIWNPKQFSKTLRRSCK